MRVIHPAALRAVSLLTLVALACSRSSDGGSAGPGLPPNDPAACNYEADFKLVEGKDTRTKPTLAKPAKGAYFRDPLYGACVVRATQHATEGDAGAGGFMRSNYSRRQAFNADDTKFIVTDSNASWWLYDAVTLLPVRELTVFDFDDTDNEPQWHATNPDIVYYRRNNSPAILRRYDVAADTTSIVKDFAAFNYPAAGGFPEAWGAVGDVRTRYEGSPSADGRYWCFIASSGGAQRGLFSWDLQSDTLTGTLDMPAGRGFLDHISTSPTGDHCVPSWDGGTYAYSRDFSSNFLINASSEHSDLALGADGDDYYVSIDWDPGVYMVNLRTHVRTELFSTDDGSWHISGKGFGKPGWVVVGNFAAGTSWWNGKVAIVELKANPRVYPLTHHHTNYGSGIYEAEPHAGPSRDFTRVIFNSNWEVASEDQVDAYVISLPPGSFP